MKTYYGIVCAFFCISLNAYHASVVLDDDPLMLPSLNHVIDVGSDTFLIHMLIDEYQKSSYRVYPFLSTITKSGLYRLASGVTGTITINASDVMLDLAGQTVTGNIVINSSLKNITIKRGVIQATSGDGVRVNAGCSVITLQNISIQNATRGIALNQVTDSVIEQCTLTSNVTGVFIDTSSNIIVRKCNAVRNTQAGFSLTLSTTCALLECSALSTGEGNTNVLNNNVYGFVSQNGFCNVFDGCLANATQALSTTDYNSIIAGFALTGTEQISRITNSQAHGAMTNSSGVTVPYGIYLQNTFSGLVSVTSVNPDGGSVSDSVYALAWSSDGIYLAAGGEFSGSSSNDMIIYQWNRASHELTQIASARVSSDSSASVRAVAWSPNGQYLAVGAEPYTTSDNDLCIYEFDRISQTLTLVQSMYLGTYYLNAIRTVAWSPNGLYLAIGGRDLESTFVIYKFDSVTQKLSQVYSFDFGNSVNTIAWSPDGKYLALGKQTAGDDVILYAFDQSTQQLIQVATLNLGGGVDTDQILAVAWSPDGKYLAMGGDIEGAGSNDQDFWIYEFNRINQSFVFVTAIAQDQTYQNSVESISWTSDGRYLVTAYGTNTNAAIVYYFDRGTQQLRLVGRADLSQNVRAVAWSPDGQYIAAGGLITESPGFDLIMYTGLSFPSDNVIKNNTVYCNSGARFPSGVGISGSSIGNLIIQNSAYDNPRNPSVVFSNYNFVCNVFNQSFGVAPTYLQNTEVNNLVLQQEDVDTTVKIIESKLSIIQQQVTALLIFA